MGRMPPRRLWLFAFAFVVLTAGGLAWALSRVGTGAAELERLFALPPGTLAWLALLSIGIYAADAFRYRAFGGALGVRLGYGACLEAAVTNFFFSWITPAGAMGAPAATYALGRRGVALDAALLITFGKSLTGIAFLLLGAFAALVAGLGPRSLSPATYGILAFGTGSYLVLVGAPVLGALFPQRTRALLRALGAKGLGMGRIAETLELSVERLARLLSRGRAALVPILAGHALYFSAFVGVAVVLARAFGAESFGRATGISIVYSAFSMVAPTPAGAGIAEAVAGPFYDSILPAREAVLAALIFRAVTFYFQLGVGAVYLAATGLARGFLR
jgi:uncharacterized membrane protein YbhN (UPF0104 family)